MNTNRNNGPLFFAPRDDYGNKMIWDEDKKEYVINEALYARPLKIAPRDSKGNKMIWNDNRFVYESKQTGEVFSTLSMEFVAQRQVEPECYMEEEALEDSMDIDEMDRLIEEDSYDEQELERTMLQQYEEEAIQEEIRRREQEEQQLLEDMMEYDYEEQLRMEEEQQRVQEEEDFWRAIILSGYEE